jgi:cell division protease FtsH
MLTDRDALVVKRPDLERQLITIMAGAAGEQLEFASLSTGASDDLHAATQLARRMVTSFGMSEALGPVTIGEAGGEVFLGASLQELGAVGPSTLDLIDGEVERFVGDAEVRAQTVLERNWSAVHETAAALLEHETLSGLALDAVLSTVQAMPIETLPGSAPPGRRNASGDA